MARIQNEAKVGRATMKAFEVEPTHIELYTREKIDDKTSAIVHEKFVWNLQQLLDWAEDKGNK